MSNHEQSLVAMRQKSLQPLYHFEVKMVGWLIKNQQIGFCDKNIGKCNALLLTTR